MQKISLDQQIIRLRKLAQRVLTLGRDSEISDSMAGEVVDLKREAQFALDDLKVARGQSYKPWSEVRMLALEGIRKKTDARHAVVMAEIDAIVAEKGSLSFEKIAHELNARGRVTPPRAIEWSNTSVRAIIRRNAKTVCPPTAVNTDLGV